jgi:hypothetical protein
LPDLLDGGSTLTDDELVELLENRDLDLVVALLEVAVQLVEEATALVDVVLRSAELDDV